MSSTRRFTWLRGAADSPVLQHVMVLMSWTALAQAMSIVSMLVLPHIFEPQQIGIFAVFSGAVVMIGVIAAARYEFAIALPRESRDASALFALCMAGSAVAGMLCVVAAAIAPQEALDRIRLAELQPWLAWVALGVAGVGWYNAASYLALRTGDYALVGQSKAITAGCTAAGQLLAGYLLAPTEGALIIPFVLAQLVSVAVIVLVLGKVATQYGSLAAMRAVARRYARFPLFIAPGSLLDGMAALLPVAVIAAVFTPAEAGMYALADRTLRAPVTLVGSSILQVFYRKLADLRGKNREGRHLLVRTWTVLGLVGLMPAVLMSLLGEEVFSLLFGDTWRPSGRLAEIIIGSVFVYFVAYPTSTILVVNERVRAFFLWQSAQFLLIGGALGWSAYGGRSLHTTVAALVAAQIATTMLSMALQWITVKENAR